MAKQPRKRKRLTDPKPVPRDFFSPVTQAASAFSVSVIQRPGERGRVRVQMTDAAVARAYLQAFERFKAANEGQSAQVALVELLEWLDVLGERTAVKGLVNVPVLRYIRGRCHHQLAFAIFEDEEVNGARRWLWFGWLPPADPGCENPKREKAYTEKLAGRPILETLEPLERYIRSLSAG
jgi:hypothetical protein